ncbi:uncharacterized protein FIBRA_06915 [Fibroporia radiculosa]|uniref:Major facilitator superfamily (MFS) profile domain-containing protein n=1 Tax=Fibroporia radiculosa TaxID=599839 RepID=J4HZU9_9APHY|nr:uncharacterized protein FIBRA_06915 [Fibroporia radiculosa]CCM04727.1 predicted protein [Fibroporia radiculosa]
MSLSPSPRSRLRPDVEVDATFQSRRPHGSRNPSPSSTPYLHALDVVNPEGLVDEEVAELLREFVHPHAHPSEDTRIEVESIGSSDDENVFSPDALAHWRQSLPWFIFLVPLSAIAMSSTLAPRVDILTRLVCEAYRPEYSAGRDVEGPLDMVFFAPTGNFARPTDDEIFELCASDPVVQQAVSKLTLTILSTMGFLSCLTTAWWGALSDRRGRTTIIGIVAIGQLVSDFTFILVAKYWQVLPGGVWFILVGPMLEGALGGVSTTSATINAYMADCTAPAARSRTFSLMLGLLFTGMSIGPTLGSIIVSYTGHPLWVFYVAISLHIFASCLVWFVIPESLSPSQMTQSRKLRTKELEQVKHARARGGFLVWLSRVFGFLTPLALLLPSAAGSDPLKRKRDWNLVLLAIGYGFIVIVVGSITTKMQYAVATFGWTSEQLGYWVSIVGAARAFHLTILLPVIIKLSQPKSPAIQLHVEPDEPLQPSETSPARGTPTPPASTPRSQRHSLSLDIAIACASLGVEFLANLLMAAAPNGAIFTAFSALGAFGSGIGPAINSVASALYTKKGGQELGKLFGALGVVQVIGSQVLGPFLYGMTFMQTVAIFPRAIFFVSAGLFALSFIMLSFIRLPSGMQHDSEHQGPEDAIAPGEEPVDDVEEVLVVVDDEEDRGTKPDAKVARPILG